jgi:hypothetical protein
VQDAEHFAGEHLLAELWPEPVSPETQEREARKAELAEQLHLMRDDTQDVNTRLEAAEAALRITESLQVTVILTRYSNSLDPTP